MIVEDYPTDNPQLSALLGSHSSGLSPQFATVRERLLLVKKNRVSDLESRLNQRDHAEDRPLFLRSIQLERSTERSAVL
jgi:hypothetical protein